MLLRFIFQDEEAFRAKMRLVLNEWVAATIQLHFGKATPENDEAFHAFLREIVPLEVIFGKDALKVDPLEKLHPLEVTGGRDGRGFPGEAINHPCSLRPITPSLSTYFEVHMQRRERKSSDFSSWKLALRQRGDFRVQQRASIDNFGRLAVCFRQHVYSAFVWS